MVASGVSLRQAMNYLNQWVSWWTQTAKSWTKHELLTWFIEACWDTSVVDVATMLLHSLDQASKGRANERCWAANQVLVLASAQ